MIGVGFIVLAGMMVLGLVATPNMAACGAHPEVNPGRTDTETVLTTVGTRSDVGQFLGDMGALTVHGGTS